MYYDIYRPPGRALAEGYDWREPLLLAGDAGRVGPDLMRYFHITSQ